MDYTDDVDIDAEGELDHSPNTETTLLDPGGFSAMGVPPPSATATSTVATSALGGSTGGGPRRSSAAGMASAGWSSAAASIWRGIFVLREIILFDSFPSLGPSSRPFALVPSPALFASVVTLASPASYSPRFSHPATSPSAPRSPNAYCFGPPLVPFHELLLAPFHKSHHVVPLANARTENTLFSRLDNLRQHAQTVHADKAAMNEAMMRELTSLHACMTGGATATTVTTPTTTTTPAATKGKKGSEDGSPSEEAPPPIEAKAPTKRPSTKRARASVVKREPVEEGLRRQRPGTSTGYEGAVTVTADEDVDMESRPRLREETAEEEPFAPIPTPPTASFFVPTATMDKALGGPSHFGAEDHNSSAVLRRRTPLPHQHPRTASPLTASPLEAFPPAVAPFHQATAPFQTPTHFPPAAAPFHPSPFPPAAAPAHPQATVRRASRRSQRSSPSSAFRPSSGHGLPGPGASGGILLPNSLTLRRPSTGDWDWSDSWADRPGTAPGKLATAAAIVDDSPFSFHPPEQPTSVGYGGGYSGYSGYSGSSGGGNPRKRTLGGPDGPYGAHTDHDEYEAAASPSWSSATSATSAPASSSLGLSALRRTGSAERDQREREQQRPTTTNGLISRASALVLHDSGDHHQQWEYEPRQHAGEQQHFATDYQSAVNGLGGWREGAGGEAQLRQALDQQQQADAMAAAAYHRHHQEQAEQAQFYHHHQQQELEERRIEEERYHQLQQQLHQQQQVHAQAYLAPYAHPHPHLAMAPGMDGMGLGLEMGMMEGYPQAHPAARGPTGAGVPAGFGLGGGVRHARASSSTSACPPPQLEVNALEAAAAAASPVSPYSLGNLPTPQLAVQLRGGDGDDGFRYAGSPGGRGGKVRAIGAGCEPGAPLDMNMNMSMNMGIGLGVGGAVG
ncbi:hypothetical protein MSAN_02484600 [Mycena sanguinolenta]|uniref:Uncharacterized protein n=1 Tax=Mycena sanguinolenta TaxID=230812 RepID=A0A8H6TZN6_9AGAR|nr:hypothetical protein MSAN_02484600 [Mycena sanguinolenta]